MLKGENLVLKNKNSWLTALYVGEFSPPQYICTFIVKINCRMTAIAQMPIGRLMSASRTVAQVAGNAVINFSEPIEDKISKIMDIITYRLPLRGVETTYQNLEEDIFSLRFDFLAQITPSQLQFLALADGRYETHTSARLDRLVADICPIYMSIMRALFSANVEYGKTTFSSDRISLTEFRLAMDFLPRRQSAQLQQFVTDSLRVEFALMAVDCFSGSNRQKLTPSVASDLYTFLKLSFERYAARAAFLTVWNSDETLFDSLLLRNIHILQSRMESEAGVFAFKANNLADIKTHFDHVS